MKAIVPALARHHHSKRTALGTACHAAAAHYHAASHTTARHLHAAYLDLGVGIAEAEGVEAVAGQGGKPLLTRPLARLLLGPLAMPRLLVVAGGHCPLRHHHDYARDSMGGEGLEVIIDPYGGVGLALLLWIAAESHASSASQRNRNLTTRRHIVGSGSRPTHISAIVVHRLRGPHQPTRDTSATATAVLFPRFGGSIAQDPVLSSARKGRGEYVSESGNQKKIESGVGNGLVNK